MILLSEYYIVERIGLNGSNLVYRAESKADQQKVILKILENTNLNRGESAQMLNEYRMAETVSFKGVAKYLKFETYNNYTIGVIADIDGISLEEYLESQPFNIYDAFKIAIGITEILEYFYSKEMVLQDLCPANFIINPQTLEVNLIDFSHASKVAGLNQVPEQAAFLMGQLMYISPEQTGRFKGEIDSRSDLYSLGVLLFRLVTGKLPFEGAEALEIIHGHIAKLPVAPHQLNPRVPVALSMIITKLLSKNAADRYQSPFGLKADLLTCLNQLSNNGTIEFFKPGQKDFSGKLRNPRHFYGREKESLVLQDAFGRVKTGSNEIVLVEGYSGIGKSALVHQLKETVLLEAGLFVNGKFNQFQRNMPYFAFIQAFREFTNYILTQSVDKIASWKEQILDAVGVNGSILTDVIPHLELLIGHQQALPELEPNETKNRFHYVFINFIKCISSKDHPLVIFFDDLQWADTASANLLKIIATSKDIQHLLFIGAYRDNEMAANSVFTATLEDIHKADCPIQKIMLFPLSYSNTNEIIDETLDYKLQDGLSLVSVVYSKSKGNPFFINAFLKCLHAENILQFDFNAFRWTWDLAKINQLRFTDDIVELMTGRIQKLPEVTQEVLKKAACLGYDFDMRLLRLVLQQSTEEIDRSLKPASLENLVLLTPDNFRFVHDRIQQAVYSLIPESIKKTAHLKIGKLLLQHLDADARNTYIFEIVNQLNAGIASITREEDDQLATLNLTAGIKAKNSAAYKPSFEYLCIGIDLLHSDCWKNNYELSLQLYSEGAESAFLSGNNREMEKWINEVLQHAAAAIDKVKVYEIRIKFFIAQNRQLDAVQACLQILSLLNVHFPKSPTKLHIIAALVKIRWALLWKPLDKLIDMPPIKKPKIEAAIRLLASVGSAVYFTLPNMFPLIVCKGFYLVIKNGNTPYSGIVCTSYGMIILGGVHDINEGYHIGKIAVQLSEKFDSGSLKCQSRMMVNTFCVHWKEHLSNTLKPLLDNYWFGLENGNIEFATYSAIVYCYNAFFCGHNLKELAEENARFYKRLQHLKHESAFNLYGICYQAVLNLYELSDNPTILTGKVYDEEKMTSFYVETRGEKALFKIYLYKLILAFLFEEHDEALQNAQEARNRIISVDGSPEVIIFYFYDTLANLSMIPDKFGWLRTSLLKKVNTNITIFKKFVKLAPANCSHKLLLIEAELHRVKGQPEKASALYDKAIAESRKNEYLNDLALSCELAGKFYYSQNREFIARPYLLQAYKYYQQWGALAKIRSMEQQYAYIFQEHQLELTLSSINLNNSKAAATENLAEKKAGELDLYSIMKAATAISGEVQLDKLIKKLVKIAVENAGAQQGYLVLIKEGEFFIEAESSIIKEEDVIVQSVPLKGNELVAESIVQFVYVTKENLVIDNSIQHPHFSYDPVIIKKNSKSILCMPIIHQGDVIGLMYFEHYLLSNAFTQNRIELLKLLSGQMAISLQNALNEQKKMNALLEREKLLQQINLHQQELLKTKLEIQEQTFQNISAEIHDNIGQTLSFIKLSLNTIDINAQEAAMSKLFELKALLTSAIQDLRDLAKTLNADHIDKIGLMNAIDQQLQFLKKTGLYTTALTVVGNVVKYESQRELIIFRIVQELLNNVVKHSAATAIDIVLDYQPKKMWITVKDNGKGFETGKQQDNKGLGLRNIHNRIALINGNISFESEENKGTAVTIELLSTAVEQK